ncbi:MAG: hypothetical protein Unbinned202contig1000_33 [Prokaryotic dsDNA virus sp.]|nr:MAG: hypothetical protein Unbinned202contig1000_33 [Prokaryotic dsDNA virus sp.]|tara:strand:- start:10545 stop:10796 length:252 start_codon:yes stop_codon:yes gene_type:complete
MTNLEKALQYHYYGMKNQATIFNGQPILIDSMNNDIELMGTQDFSIDDFSIWSDTVEMQYFLDNFSFPRSLEEFKPFERIFKN